jgi:ABC transport system ATP-binding/permease protein
MPPVLHLRDIALSFGGAALLDGAELMAEPGARVALVGRNGSGKSTLLKIAAGLAEADEGSVFVQPGATVRYLPQEPDLSGFASTLAYVEAGLTEGDDPHRARTLLEALGMTGAESPSHLSGGEARRAALARVLAPKPDILLLDEPTNHLDLPAIEWLEGELASLASALVLISHDRRFLERLSRACVWLDRGRTRRMERGFQAFEAWRDEVLEQEEIERHKLDRQIVREEHWLRYGVTARRKRNVKRLAGLQSLRRTAREWRGPQGSVTLEASSAEGRASLVIEADGISKSYGGTALVSKFSIRIARGDRIGIAGANGAGKTTLVNLLTGVLAPDAGTVKRAATIAQVTLDQRRALPDESAGVAETLTGGGEQVRVNGQSRHVLGYLKDFLFTPEQARQQVSALSGGERARLILAKALATPSNLLVLDEPTNDLDLETLDLLEELIADYPGTVLLVSHDRDFLDRTATAILMAEGKGQWTLYAGGYSDMLAQRGAGVQARVAAKGEAAAKEKGPAGASTRGRKLSFKEKHALETLPGEMEALRTEIAGLQARLADAGLFARDRSGFDKASAGLSAAQEKLEAAEDRWLELEMLREALEG